MYKSDDVFADVAIVKTPVSYVGKGEVGQMFLVGNLLLISHCRSDQGGRGGGGGSLLTSGSDQGGGGGGGGGSLRSSESAQIHINSPPPPPTSPPLNCNCFHLVLIVLLCQCFDFSGMYV